jgi:hypothetical protein
LAARTQLIEPIDKVLGKLQQELATIESLKAGLSSENKEKNPLAFSNVYINNVQSNNK